jgi:hypothetical protein
MMELVSSANSNSKFEQQILLEFYPEKSGAEYI